MRFKKVLFIDRDGTLIQEPLDQQIDHLEKLQLEPDVIPALLALKQAGYVFVMISNQDGLGTSSFPQISFDSPHNLLLSLLKSQGIVFEDVLICPHFQSDLCNCRKPKLGLVSNYLRDGVMDPSNSWVIGDRTTDLQLAENIGIKSLLYSREQGWKAISELLISQPRCGLVERNTHETSINVHLKLDGRECSQIKTKLGFFDHMLEQLAKHAGWNLQLRCEGDLHIDEHHTVEDTGLALGEALRLALGSKLGIRRYGFLLPMDEALAQIAIDLSGRPFFVFEGQFKREKIGELPTELVPHFFRSFAQSLGATLHIKVIGENEHHMIESIFKGVGRALRQASTQQGYELPSTKGVL